MHAIVYVCKCIGLAGNTPGAKETSESEELNVCLKYLGLNVVSCAAIDAVYIHRSNVSIQVGRRQQSSCDVRTFGIRSKCTDMHYKIRYVTENKTDQWQ